MMEEAEISPVEFFLMNDGFFGKIHRGTDDQTVKKRMSD